MPSAANRPQLSQDALVAVLAPDPGSLPDVTVLHGYLGKSAVKGAWRLYLTPALDAYVEIPEDKILHHRRLSEDQGTIVWVPRGLGLEHRQVKSEEVQAEFLAGPIASRHLRPDDNSQPVPWLRDPGIPASIGCYSVYYCPSLYYCPGYSRYCDSVVGCTNRPHGLPC
jgi:hypothetical protein